MTLTITLRLTHAALDAVPNWGTTRQKVYIDNHRCLICQAIRRRFPDVEAVSVIPGRATIDGVQFDYDAAQHESRIEDAHRHPREFKPFSIKLTRQ